MSNVNDNTLKGLLAKYDVPAPRYTSYPTVPYWEDSPTSDEWTDSIKTCMNAEDSSWSMYIHIPFCKQACHYCDFHFSTSLKKKDELITAAESEAKTTLETMQTSVKESLAVERAKLPQVIEQLTQSFYQNVLQ